MPFARNDDARIYWKIEGAADRAPLVLLNSIGTDMGLWEACLPHLLPDFRVLRIDTRGHGASDAPDGDYTLSTLARDVVAAMDAAGIAQARIAGVSLGGMIGMQLALDHPDRVAGLSLICTSATMDRDAWQTRVDMVRSEGMDAIADLAMGRFLDPAFVASHPEIAESIRGGLLTMDPAGYAGAGCAIRDMELAGRLNEIAAPTLVVTGMQDLSTPRDPHGERLLADIPDATGTELKCAHLAPVEAPRALAGALRRFFLTDHQVDAAGETLFEAGLRNRRRVLGDAWVDRSLAGRTPFTADFQAMITRIAWQEIWGRPGLDDRTRRLLVLAITASLSRWEEFALHVRSGLEQGGFTRDELKEVLMQTAIYAGVPAANTGFSEAVKIIDALDARDAAAPE
ncbi:3-oxoadipate enol-lactonase [Croceicoccus sp. YJ47]|uniref:bifunctional 3-oxoadipate enol-lactonase/4-carboxymuconolactone decarboxylase PcaDC n=1 Tax=Croceicoccus sp. YJ47 TaxID=2798724 RepID=UPI001925065A|nr:3-oxoadipate enol-lactonase [Croceicoccus sp. YJ47]QQN73541.1 3-oxoadipate enol-lactonase [Croceicoccus sp. YJ47]